MYEYMKKCVLHCGLHYSGVHITEAEGTDRATSLQGNDEHCFEMY